MPVQFRDINNSQITFVNEEKDPAKKTEALEAENAALKLALAELAESQEQERLNTQLALAELAESMMGGVE